MKFIILFLISLLIVPSGYPLALQSEKFADNVTIAAPGVVTTKWFDIRNFHYADFTIVASAGDGALIVEYSSDKDGLSLIADPTNAAFDNTQAASLYAAGLGKFYIRLKVNCVTSPCIYSGWFTAKGQI